MSTDPTTSIVAPVPDALSWGAFQAPVLAEPAEPAPKVQRLSVAGTPMVAGELRTVTRQEALIDKYHLDASDKYQAGTALAVAELDRAAEVWARTKATRIDRGEIVDGKSAIKTVTADLQNVGSLLGNLLFGE